MWWIRSQDVSMLRDVQRSRLHHKVVTSDCSDSSCISSASFHLLLFMSFLASSSSFRVAAVDSSHLYEDVSSGKKKKQVSVKSLDQSERNWLNLLHQCPDLDDGNAQQQWVQALVATLAQCRTGSPARPSWQTMTNQKATEA